MRSPGIRIAAAVAAVCAAGAVGCFARGYTLRSEAGWLLERGKAQADAYARTFESGLVERQLATFEQRREVLERAHLWESGEVVFILLCVLAGAVGYGFFIADRLRYEVEELRGPVAIPVPEHDAGAALPHPVR